LFGFLLSFWDCLGFLARGALDQRLRLGAVEFHKRTARRIEVGAGAGLVFGKRLVGPLVSFVQPFLGLFRVP
jgi:hypothetical protein